MVLVEKVMDFFILINFIVVFYVGKGEVCLRIFCFVFLEVLVKEIIDLIVEEIKAIVGLDYFG